ncbi:putative LysR family transcriptional regulator [Vibrio halioticoli NBRC 102217]|uniref:Putative LysR family transcriptional regulator n=1 Tax=Vibrio halioticoli NBRC 102217 TaxID=1219072 RepID=V5FBH2_9VIBR|nr:LysR family transcriptional regulator [Vibrio halioticoli]GAD88638.1 putative LysR family transcriptional regulator [Vibrio halioticoli NBRC 102217]
MNKLDNMLVFNTIVEHKGLTAAAHHLNTSPATITSKLKALEQYYGVKLLNRTTRSMSLTDEGKKFYQLSCNALSHIDVMEEQFQNKSQRLSGNLRISATRDLGKNVIAPMVDEFIALHPDVVPHLILSDEVLSIHRYRLDAIFRYSHLVDSQLISRRLRASKRVLCASPDYLKRHGVPDSLKDLLNHRCIGSQHNEDMITRWQFFVDGELQSIAINPCRLSNDGEIIKRWAIDGHGIALKSWVDIRQDLKAGRLKIVLPSYLPDFSDGSKTADLHLIYPHRDFLPTRTRVFIEFVVNYFKKDNDSR